MKISEIIDRIKKNKIKVIIIIIASFFLSYLGIGMLYQIGDIVPLIKTKFSPSDILSYMGAFFTLVGTIILSILALWQNEKIEENNNKFQELQQTQFSQLLEIQKNTKQPLLIAYENRNIRFIPHPDDKDKLVADFVYKFKLLEGIGFGFIAEVEGLYFFNKTSNQTVNNILIKDNPIEGGKKTNLNDEKQFISNDLLSKNNCLSDKLAIGAYKKDIEEYDICVLHINICYTDIYNNQHTDRFYFAYQKLKPNDDMQIEFINYCLRR
jgi:hypothetical protein